MNRTKKIGLSLLALLCCIFSTAQTAVTKGEYWFDQQFDSRQTVTLTAGVWNQQIDVSSLEAGIHTLSIRVGTDDNRWGSVFTKYFIVPQVESVGENAVTAYRYWIDGENVKEGSMDAGGIANIEIDVESLSKGLHRIDYQVKDKFGQYSPLYSSFFMIGLDASETNQIVAYEYWFNDQPHKRLEVDAANVVTIEEEIIIEGVEPETVLANYEFDAENKQVIFTHDVQFSFLAFNNAGVSTEAVTEIIKDHKSAMDIPFTKLSLEKENEVEAPVGNQIQGYEFNCQVEDKVYWFVKAESQHIDFYDAAGNLLTPEKEMVGDEQALVVTAPTSTVYVLTYGAEGENAKDVIKVVQPIEIAFENSERAYGEENPTFTYVTERPDLLVGIPVGVTEATTTSGIGDYTITLDPTSISNSMVTVTDATLTVNKAPLTIKAKDYTIKQGEDLPAFEMEYEGFKNEETAEVLTTQATIATTATSASEIGTYDITVSGAEAQNYELTFVKGTLTIAAADPVTITAKSYEIEYGDELPTFEFTSEGATLDGTPAITCEIPAGAPAGTYPIVIGKGGVTNYNDNYVNGTLTITKAKLTITADDIEVHQDEEMPVLTWKAEGWKNDEDESVLTVQPVCTTEGTPDSPLGDYTITISGAEAANYDITYVDGKLTVSVPVGIASFRANVAPADIYTLQGIKVRSKAESLDGLAEGYYIVNRRKVFIRRR